MQTITQEKLNIKIIKTDSSVLPQRAWQMGLLYTRILEHIDYNLRKALAGSLSSQLQCTSFTAQNNDSILVAAGCLYSVDNPAVAIIRPVCTDPGHREKGLALQVCGMLLEQLKAQGIQAVQLGVKDNLPASNLYKKLGFTERSGIVMQKLFVSKDEFNKRYSPGQQTIIRNIDWLDFAKVSALFCEPATIYSFDFCRQRFSTKYVEAQRFLPVFSCLMNCFEENGGFGFVFQAKDNHSIVGTAFVKQSSSKMQNHVTVLVFFVLDGFLGKGKDLVSETIKQSALNGNWMILCCCSDRDTFKKQILLSLGAGPYAALFDFIRTNNKLQDTIIYKLTGKL